MHYFNRARSSCDRIARLARRPRPYGFEALECRKLLNATLTAAPPAVYAVTNSGPTTIDLNTYLSDSDVPGKFVLMQTNKGNIPIALSNDSAVSQTVQNFENYVDSGEYDNTFFHRVVTTTQSAQTGTPYGIVQGGSYSTSLNQVQDLTTQPLPLQYKLLNAVDTIAMARGQQQDSATSGFFFNAVDNSSAFSQSDAGGYAVFGNVLYITNVTNTVNTIYTLPQTPLTTNDGTTQTNVPVLIGNSPPTTNNLVVIESAAVTSPLTFGASTDNNQLVTPAISPDGTLTLTYVPGATGTAHIDVNAQDYGSNVVTTSFTVNVGALPTTTATVGKGQARIIRFTDPNGVAGTATLAGPGTATLSFTGGGITTSTKAGVETVSGTPQAVSITTTGTSAATVLSITGAVVIARVSTDGNIGSILASRATLTGGLSDTGTAGTINFAAANSGTITISGTGRSTVLRITSSNGESINDTGAIGSINTGSWTSGGPISASAINRIAATHEFNAGIVAAAVGLVTAGSITPSAWSISGKVAGISAGSITGLNLSAGVIGPITDRGAAQSDEFTSSGSIGAVYALSMSGTQIEAAAGSPDPSGLATAFSTNATIASVVIGNGGFSNSLIEGQTLRHVSLGALSSANGGTPFGVVSGDIALLTATIDGKRVSLTRATSAAAVTAALSKAGITPVDLVIRIVS